MKPDGSTLQTLVSHDATFERNAHEQRKLAEQLRDRVEQAALGGPAAARERHVARGKLLPRARIVRAKRLGEPVP